MSSQTVVVGYPADAAGRAALRMAAGEARMRGARLRIVHQLVGPEMPYRYGRDSDYRAAQRAATPIVRDALTDVAPWMDDYELLLVTSSAAEELTSLSRHADLVVLGVTTSHPFAAAAFDTVPRAVVARAKCPVMLVPAHVNLPPRQLVCGVDETAGSAAALRWAAADAGMRGLTLLALNVAPRHHATAATGDRITEWVQALHPIAETTVVCSREHSRHPARRLLEAAERRRALLVVGAHDSSRRRWRRSVAQQVSAQADVAVVIVPEPSVGSRAPSVPDLAIAASG